MVNEAGNVEAEDDSDGVTFLLPREDYAGFHLLVDFLLAVLDVDVLDLTCLLPRAEV